MSFFTFWSGPGGEDAIATWRADWTRHGVDCRVYGDDDVRPLAAAALGPDFADLWDRIALPTAKSDLARLILLWAYGGVYLDIHVGSTNAEGAAALAAMAQRWDLVLFDLVDRAKKDGTNQSLCNNVLTGRARAPVLARIVASIGNALRVHAARQAASSGPVPYHLPWLTGMSAIEREILEKREGRYVVRASQFGRVWLRRVGGEGRYEDLLFHAYRHYGYRSPGQHWSEREKRENLFLPRQS